MGRWYEEKKRIDGMEDVSWVRIEPGLDGRRLRVTFLNGIREFETDKVEICLSSHELGKHYDRDDNLQFYEVDEWGDCGGPCHYDDVLYIDARDQKSVEDRRSQRKLGAVVRTLRKKVEADEK